MFYMDENKKLEELVASIEIQKEEPVNKKAGKEIIRTRAEILKSFYLTKELYSVEKLLRNVEEEAIKLRNYLAKSDYFEGIADAVEEKTDAIDLRSYERNIYGIDISFVDDDMINIKIPAILPHRKTKPDLVYADLFRDILIEFKNGNPGRFEVFQKALEKGAVIAVVHSYQTSWMVRDNDNVELKKIIDILVRTGYLREDSGTWLSIYLTALIQKTDDVHTNLFIIPKRKFVDFVKNYYFE